MSIVLNPLGIPPETAIIVTLATTPILDPLITLANVSGVCALTATVAKKRAPSGELDHEGHPSDLLPSSLENSVIPKVGDIS